MPANASARIRVVQPGPLTLIQDCGRIGFQQLGVSVSGAVDSDSLAIGNLLVGNDDRAAALEVAVGYLTLEFCDSALFAITGADMSATLDGVPLALNVSYFAHAQSRLELAGAQGGLRTFVAVAGGIDVPELLGSRSTHLASGIGGLDGRQLAEGATLTTGEADIERHSGRSFDVSALAAPSDELEIRVVLGPQDDLFSEQGIETFLGSSYEVAGESNRQGLRLDGPEIESKSGRYDIVSDAVVNGSIQVPGDGKPIVLLADRQTTGGYAKIATVASVDLPKLGQASPNTKIRFTAISMTEAQRLYVEHRTKLASTEVLELANSVSLKVGFEHISVGIADFGSSRLAVVDGIGYPFSVEKITPAN